MGGVPEMHNFNALRKSGAVNHSSSFQGFLPSLPHRSIPVFGIEPRTSEVRK
jgi:hypothetical protein